MAAVIVSSGRKLSSVHMTSSHSQDPLFFAVVDQETDLAAGMVSYLHITPAGS